VKNRIQSMGGFWHATTRTLRAYRSFRDTHPMTNSVSFSKSVNHVVFNLAMMPCIQQACDSTSTTKQPEVDWSSGCMGYPGRMTHLIFCTANQFFLFYFSSRYNYQALYKTARSATPGLKPELLNGPHDT
jgi:hypothetical protein